MDRVQGAATHFKYDSMPSEKLWGMWGGWGDALVVCPAHWGVRLYTWMCFIASRGKIIACCALSQHLVMGKVTASRGGIRDCSRPQQVSEGASSSGEGATLGTKGLSTTWPCYRLCALKRRSLHWLGTFYLYHLIKINLWIIIILEGDYNLYYYCSFF